MAKTKSKTKESDGAYVLKLVLYIVVGTQWVFLKTKSGGEVPLPIGAVIGSIFALHEHFQIDRKIEYALLLVAAMVGLFAQIGLFITL